MLSRKAVLFFLLTVASLLVGVCARFIMKGDSPMEIASDITTKFSVELKIVDAEAEHILTKVDEASWASSSHSFFLIDRDTVVRWNSTQFLPDTRLIRDEFKIRLLQSSRGSFIVKRWNINESRYLIAVVPLFEKYSISNRYLFPTWNERIFDKQKVEVLESTRSDGIPISVQGDVLLKIKLLESNSEQDEWRDTIILSAGWLAIFFFGAGLYLVVVELHRRKRFERAFTVLLACLAVIRFTMVSVNFPKDYSTLFIFDPLQFASSSLNPSIADLFFNTLAVLLVASYFFYTYYQWTFIKQVKTANAISRFIVAVILLVICFYAVLFPFLFFETISHNSSIPIDISQSINFDLIRILAFLSIMLGSVSGFLFCHAFFKTAVAMMDHSRFKFYVALAIASLIFFIAYKFDLKEYSITLLSGVIYLLVLFLTGLSSSLRRFSYATFLYFFLAIVVLSVQGSFSIKRFVEEKTKEDQFKYGSNFLVDRDILGEYLLNEAVKRISDDPFIRSRMTTPFLAKSGVRQKINQVHLNSYFDRYDVQVYLYSASGESHDDVAKESFATLIKAFQNEANKTTYEGIYFIEGANHESAKRYLAIIPIQQHGPAGYVVLDLALKKLVPQNVFPELLVDNQFINYFKNSDYSYAVFSTGRLINSSGEFNYERNFNPELLGEVDLYRKSLHVSSFVHLGMEDETGEVAVISVAEYPLIKILANFSFLFVLGLSLVLCLLILFAIILWVRGERLNYAARIQAYIYLAFLLPLLAVSITTLSLISSSEESDLTNEFLNKSRIIGGRLTGDLGSHVHKDGESSAEFEKQLLNLARLANLDVSIFSREGKLIASSQPLIYQNQFVSTLIDREAWRRIVEDKENAFVKSDAIGKLKFNTSYSSLKSQETGELIGILSIPFFDSVHSLEKTQINVWMNILVIFVFVFLLFSVVSFFIVNWLTFPLRFITRTLGKTTFSGENKPLVWKSNDEIGLLVNEYNRMIENLERSRIELSRIQKESAWREIAKQVAHEINNPLTPMKLTLQRMELAQGRGILNKEDIEKSLNTLLAQVEILNQIASSFSAFARMPAPVLQRTDIYQVLKRVVDLHVNQAAATVQLQSAGPVFILGDEQLLTRVFSNVVLNAQQSGEDGKLVQIVIGIKTVGNFCLVSITDNGRGIDDSLKEKVFQPHFSTKKTGSGIGLAIAKQGTELSGGEIWFESTVGAGTTFYVKIPLTN